MWGPTDRLRRESSLLFPLKSAPPSHLPPTLACARPSPPRARGDVISLFWLSKEKSPDSVVVRPLLPLRRWAQDTSLSPALRNPPSSRSPSSTQTSPVSWIKTCQLPPQLISPPATPPTFEGNKERVAWSSFEAT